MLVRRLIRHAVAIAAVLVSSGATHGQAPFPADPGTAARSAWRPVAPAGTRPPEPSAAVPAQTTLPATPATSSTTSQATSRASARAGRADVAYRDGLLTVAANNSSLNGILREIARQTGMKITGGVPEDRVFGTYGPAAPGAILTSLLDGTGSNVLLVENSADAPTELVLTPRRGGATPPNPNASLASDEENQAGPIGEPPQNPAIDRQQQLQRFQQAQQGGIQQGAAQQSTPAQQQAEQQPNTSQPVAFPPVNASMPGSTATTSNTDSGQSGTDGVKTPQQIFEQLQRLRLQQQGTTSTQGTGTR